VAERCNCDTLKLLSLGLFGSSISFPLAAPITSKANRTCVIRLDVFFGEWVGPSWTLFFFLSADEMFLEQRRYLRCFPCAPAAMIHAVDNHIQEGLGVVPPFL
jgi:hypothetical protein